MDYKKGLPDWLISSFRVALLGEIYPSIRAIAVGYSEEEGVLIRYYLDRAVEEFDKESIEVVATNLEATVTEVVLSEIHVECCFSCAAQKDLDPMSGFIYARRECFQ